MMIENELREVQARVRELGKRLDANPRYQEAIKKLREKSDNAWNKIDYEKNEIENGRIPDLEKYDKYNS